MRSAPPRGGWIAPGAGTTAAREHQHIASGCDGLHEAQNRLPRARSSPPPSTCAGPARAICHRLTRRASIPPSAQRPSPNPPQTCRAPSAPRRAPGATRFTDSGATAQKPAQIFSESWPSPLETGSFGTTRGEAPSAHRVSASVHPRQSLYAVSLRNRGTTQARRGNPCSGRKAARR